MYQCWHCCPRCKADHWHEIRNESAPLDNYRTLCSRCKEAQTMTTDFQKDSRKLKRRWVEEKEDSNFSNSFPIRSCGNENEYLALAFAQADDEIERRLLLTIN